MEESQLEISPEDEFYLDVVGYLIIRGVLTPQEVAACNEAIDHVGGITPVPGGVGPMTIACLLRNTVIAACIQNDIQTPDI